MIFFKQLAYCPQTMFLPLAPPNYWNNYYIHYYYYNDKHILQQSNKQLQENTPEKI